MPNTKLKGDSSMNEFKILIEICNLTTQDTKTILLPNPSLKKILMNFGDKIPQNNLIINYSSLANFLVQF